MQQLIDYLLTKDLQDQPRSEFNDEVDQFVANHDPEQAFIFANRLEYLAGQLKDKYYDDYKEIREKEGESTVHKYGDKITMRQSKDYIFPHDQQLETYHKKQEQIEEQIEPYKNELKGIKQSIKAREKSLIQNGDAIESETKISLSIAKK